ncbi:MAG: hypothetical protein LUG62_04630 [Clostridiales bacterium]|nr:hypothetical protein [Clostridiales bacterium]
MSYNSIRPGQLWLDTEGKPIQAHGFSVFYSKEGQLYYWYGENKEKTKGGKARNPSSAGTKNGGSRICSGLIRHIHTATHIDFYQEELLNE